MDRFSSRHGFEPEDSEITVRHDAPPNLRGVVVDIAYESGLDPHSMRAIVCSTLRVREDRGNWSAYPNVDGEVRDHLDTCQWFEVYDIIESTHAALLRAARSRTRSGDEEPRPEYFADEINKVFRKQGVGWQLVRGQLPSARPRGI